MSPTLTDASPVLHDPRDGVAALGRTGSTIAETYGIPLAVLLELTHRCPLQCPYCSNPVEMERASNELTTEEGTGLDCRKPLNRLLRGLWKKR